MESSDRPDRQWFTEDETQRIVRRAVELNELRQAGWSDADLRKLATDLGVEPEVMSIAIDEAVRRRAAIGPSAALRSEIRQRFLTFGGWYLVGTAAFLSIIGQLSYGIVAVAALAVTSVLLALDSRGHRPFARYWTRTAGLWGGFFASAWLLVGVAGVGLVAVPIGAGTAALVLIRLVQQLTPQPGAAPPSGGGAPLSWREALSRVRENLARMRNWFARTRVRPLWARPASAAQS